MKGSRCWHSEKNPFLWTSINQIVNGKLNKNLTDGLTGQHKDGTAILEPDTLKLLLYSFGKT